MPIFVAITILDFMCIYHVVTRRNELYWIVIIMMAPFMGALAYVLFKIMPEFMGSPKVDKAFTKFEDKMDPERRYRRLTDQLAVTPSRENKKLLAEECLKLGKFAQSLDLYREARDGLFAHDASLMLGTAQAQKGLGQYQAAIDTLDDLRAHHPKFESPEGHLVYAQSLAGLGRNLEAESEFEALVGYFPGEEARYHFAVFLKSLGRAVEAEQLLNDLVNRVRISTQYNQQMQAEWVSSAKKMLSQKS